MTTDIASSPVGNDGLAGRRILVAEDRGLIAVKVAQVLRGAGCVVVGPVGTLAAGLEIARRDDGLPDAGVLDIDLHGEQVFPLAEALRARRVPSLFLTGYGPLGVPEPWRDVPHLEKPFDPADLLAVLASIVAGHPTSPHDGVPVPGRPSDLIQKSREVMRHTRNLLTEGRILQEYRGPGKPG